LHLQFCRRIVRTLRHPGDVFSETTMNFATHKSLANALQPERCGTASHGLRADLPRVGEDNQHD